MNRYDDIKYISLNTQHAVLKPNSGSGNTYYEKTFLSQIDFNLKDVLKDDDDILHTHVDILNAQIPVSFYLVNYTTNILKYTVNGGVIQTMTLERGNYNTNSLIKALKEQFLVAGFTFSIVLNKVNGKLTFSTTAPFIFLSGISTISEILGFDSGTTSYSSVGSVLVSDHPLNLIGIKKLKISSTALRTSSLSSGLGGDLLAIIPVNAVPFGLILYENNSIMGGLLLNNTVNNIDISIRDENNRFINFNNTEYSITIRLIITRINKEKNLIPFRDITQTLTLPSQPTALPPPQETFSDENDLDFFMYKHGVIL